MTAILDRLLERFPHFRTASGKAGELDTSLGDKFLEFETVEHRLARLDSAEAADDPDEYERLRHRRAALEDELLRMMQHYGRS